MLLSCRYLILTCDRHVLYWQRMADSLQSKSIRNIILQVVSHLLVYFLLTTLVVQIKQCVECVCLQTITFDLDIWLVGSP